jgi:hypothetical protein
LFLRLPAFVSLPTILDLSSVGGHYFALLPPDNPDALRPIDQAPESRDICDCTENRISIHRWLTRPLTRPRIHISGCIFLSVFSAHSGIYAENSYSYPPGLIFLNNTGLPPILFSN